MAQKSFYRSDRVAAQLRRELGTIVHQAVREHGLPSVSVSDVEVTRDLAHAKVFVTALQQEQSVEAVKGLKALTPEMRYQLGRAMKLRHVPELHFHYDDSVDRGERINHLLRENPPVLGNDDSDGENSALADGSSVVGAGAVAADADSVADDDTGASTGSGDGDGNQRS